MIVYIQEDHDSTDKLVALLDMQWNMAYIANQVLSEEFQLILAALMPWKMTTSNFESEENVKLSCFQ